MPNLETFIHTLTGTDPANGSASAQIAGPFFVMNTNALATQTANGMGVTNLPNLSSILDGSATNATTSIPIVVPDNCYWLQVFVMLILKNSQYSSGTGSLTMHPYGRVRANNIPQQSAYPQSIIPGLPDIVLGRNLTDPTKAFGHWTKLGCIPANGSSTFNLSELLHGTATASAPYLFGALAAQPNNFCSISNWSHTTPDTNVWRFYLSNWSAMTASGNPSSAQPFDIKGYDRVLINVTSPTTPSFTTTATGEGDTTVSTNFLILGHFY